MVSKKQFALEYCLLQHPMSF